MIDESRPHKRRIHTIDAARGAALVAMAIYHFTWDLDYFGYVRPGLSTTGGWAIFAHLIAGSFLFISGYSLYMAHGRELRLRSFAKRTAILVAASLAITVVSLFATPEAPIYFGILHAITVASILGLAFMRVPAVVSLVLAIVVAILPFLVSFPALDPVWLAWIGMANHPPVSNDYVPLFPWFSPFLAGIAISRLTLDWLRRQPQRPGRENILTFFGRHSLVFYLVHQPVLFGLVFAAATIMPPDPSPAYLSSCQTSCEATDPAGFCRAYCACTLTELKNQELFTPLMQNETTHEDAVALNRIGMMCSSQPSSQ